MTADVRRPGPGAYMGALVELGRGTWRPRPPDERLIRSIRDAGLPAAQTIVRVRRLPQHPRRVPAFSVVEGLRGVPRAGIAMNSFVVTHPQATFIVDPALCRDARRRAMAELPWLLRRAVSIPSSATPTTEGLGGTRLDFALPTHAHWDHVCGLLDLPGVPVVMRELERHWVLDGAVAPVGGVRRALERAVDTYDLDGPPVATFAASHDLFGDGSVVLVELGGHTPGSVGVLAHTDSGWLLLAGDAAWRYEQVDLLRQKPGFPGRVVDSDRDAAFASLHRLHLARHQVRVIPTHDHDAVQLLGRHEPHEPAAADEVGL